MPAARHILVTNDFPPKLGGIQTYLWELWRRLPAEDFMVITTPHPQAEAFDSDQPFAIERVAASMLLPTPATARLLKDAAARFEADLVVLDPALPIGALGPGLGLPYAVVVHGAEVSVPGHLPGLRQALGRVLARANLVISAGEWTEREARKAAGGRLGAVAMIPPGIDCKRFTPSSAQDRASMRQRLGVPEHGLLVGCVSRLVPRKGVDVLVEAVAELARFRPGLRLAVAGTGRQGPALVRRSQALGAPVEFLGRLEDRDLPGFYAAADVFTMCCRDRWGGLEQEGFGIVFLEAAACGVPAVAGRSGGAGEAVADGVTGLVVDRPGDPAVVAAALASLLDDPKRRAAMAEAARIRACSDFNYDALAGQLQQALQAVAEGASTAAPGR